MTHFLIIGASRGLGLGFSIGLPDPGDTVFLVSRTRPPSLDRSDQVSRACHQIGRVEVKMLEMNRLEQR